MVTTSLKMLVCCITTGRLKPEGRDLNLPHHEDVKSRSVCSIDVQTDDHTRVFR